MRRWERDLARDGAERDLDDTLERAGASECRKQLAPGVPEGHHEIIVRAELRRRVPAQGRCEQAIARDHVRHQCSDVPALARSRGGPLLGCDSRDEITCVCQGRTQLFDCRCPHPHPHRFSDRHRAVPTPTASASTSYRIERSAA